MEAWQAAKPAGAARVAAAGGQSQNLAQEMPLLQNGQPCAGGSLRHPRAACTVLSGLPKPPARTRLKVAGRGSYAPNPLKSQANLAKPFQFFKTERKAPKETLKP